jgi:zinc protease
MTRLRRWPRAVPPSALALIACGGAAPPPVSSPPPLSPPTASKAEAPPPASDSLGPRPATPMPSTYLPPSAEVVAGPKGITLWLLERHQVPIVSCDLTVPSGASSDPKGKAGLAYVTANMLDEGAGSRGAIDLARAIDDLGARIQTDANADASFVSLTVAKHNLDRAFALFGDVVARPRFDAVEFKRVKDLWGNELREREKDPDATARVVYRAVLFGPEHPYGHAWDGTPASAESVGLDDVKKLYATAWRPDRAILVCVGDMTQKELLALTGSAFGGWKAPPKPAPEPVVPPPPKGPWPKLVLVDRADAPQAVIAAVKPGLSASAAEAPALWRVNDAIGGSFTSRLNQDLREEHGYTYGARTRYSMSRGAGQVVSWANVVTDKTGDALAAMLADLHKFADGGLTDDEVERTRSQARGDLVNTYETVEAIAGHLAADASLGLAADNQSKASQARDAADKGLLDRLAKQYYDPTDAILVVVGPRARLKPMLDKLGLPAPEIRDAEGLVVKTVRPSP